MRADSRSISLHALICVSGCGKTSRTSNHLSWECQLDRRRGSVTSMIILQGHTDVLASSQTTIASAAGLVDQTDTANSTGRPCSRGPRHSRSRPRKALRRIVPSQTSPPAGGRSATSFLSYFARGSPQTCDTSLRWRRSLGRAGNLQAQHVRHAILQVPVHWTHKLFQRRLGRSLGRSDHLL